ncbi:MAG: NAD(P)/FAD-dependent oxidoreductase [Candidatus Micrarchaeia archaeon]
MKKVLIVGGGAGGIILANSLDKKNYDVTILDKSDMQVFQPWFLYMAFEGKNKNISKPTVKLLNKGSKFIKEEVKTIDLDNRSVQTASNTYSYDYLVVATGTVTDTSSIRGLQEINSKFGDYHTNIDNSMRLWSNINSFSGGTLALGQASPTCKCPPSPLEGILLAEQLLTRKKIKQKSKLVFFTPYPRAYPAEPINKIVEPIMKARGIDIYTFFDVDYIDTQKSSIYSIEGDEIHYDLPIVIPPCVGVKIEYKQDVLDQDRFVKADKYTMRIQGYDDAFAIGDATNIPTSKSGVTAHLQAKVVASIIEGQNVIFNGRTHCPFDMAYGKATFVIGSYTQPVVPYPPSAFKHFMKMMMAKIYWSSLKGTFDFMFDTYFKMTDPEKLNKKYK